MRRLLLLLPVFFTAVCAITVTHFPQAYEQKRHAADGGHEYLLADGRYWTSHELAGIVDRIRGAHGKGCSLKDVAQSNATSYLVVWCALPSKVNPQHIWGPTAADIQPETAELNGPKYAVYSFSGPGIQTSAPWHLDRLDVQTATYDQLYAIVTLLHQRQKCGESRSLVLRKCHKQWACALHTIGTDRDGHTRGPHEWEADQSTRHIR
jgi:hypothetical protein